MIIGIWNDKVSIIYSNIKQPHLLTSAKIVCYNNVTFDIIVSIGMFLFEKPLAARRNKGGQSP